MVARKRKPVSAAELKRQIAALKLENKELKEERIEYEQEATEYSSGLEEMTRGPALAPVVIRKTFETEEQVVGQDAPRVMKNSGPASEALEPQYIQPVENPVSNDKLAMLAFMEEEVLLLVHETTDKLAVPIPKVTNDGTNQYFIRGQEQQVKRKFIEILARCKATTFTQEKGVDGLGNEVYLYIPHTALAYPFSVLQDSNPRGLAWLKAVLAEV